MIHKTVTVKAVATLRSDLQFAEFEFPIIKKYLEEGYQIKEIIHSTTNVNTAFLFITFHLIKQ